MRPKVSVFVSLSASKTRFPLRAAKTARAQERVVFPTPPLPELIRRRLSSNSTMWGQPYSIRKELSTGGQGRRLFPLKKAQDVAEDARLVAPGHDFKLAPVEPHVAAALAAVHDDLLEGG